MTASIKFIDGVERSIVSMDAWREASKELLVREKAHMKVSDELAAQRRQLPWIEIKNKYSFEGPNGQCELAELFHGRRQLIVYHHMLKPEDSAPCSGCSMVADQIPHLAHLHKRNTTLVFVSKAPYSEITRFSQRMEWSFPWYSTLDNFNVELDVSGGFGVNVFFKDTADTIFRTYFTSQRAVETLGTIWSFLDLTPLGRQEKWELSPDGTAQSEPYQWWRLHDEYEI